MAFARRDGARGRPTCLFGRTPSKRRSGACALQQLGVDSSAPKADDDRASRALAGKQHESANSATSLDFDLSSISGPGRQTLEPAPKSAGSEARSVPIEGPYYAFCRARSQWLQGGRELYRADPFGGGADCLARFGPWPPCELQPMRRCALGLRIFRGPLQITVCRARPRSRRPRAR